MLIFSGNDARITIWEEVNGEKKGDALISELMFVQNVSLETVFQEIIIPQIGYTEVSTEIVTNSHNFKGELFGYLSKEDADSLSDIHKVYQIEVSFSPVNIYTLYSCKPVGTWVKFQSDNNQSIKMRFEYQVKNYS